jgi:hypothetical protein
MAVRVIPAPVLPVCWTAARPITARVTAGR